MAKKERIQEGKDIQDEEIGFSRRKAKKQRFEGDQFANPNSAMANLMFEPDIPGHPEYDKNLTTTNLRSRYKEPEKARTILSSLNILQKYSEAEKVKKMVGYEIVEDEDGKRKKPVYEEVEVPVYKYPRITNHLMDKIRSLVLTSKARDGFAVREHNKRRTETKQTIEDKTKNTRKFYDMFNRDSN